MVRINRSVIAKAIFSISVVAGVATAGVVGFAQADRSPGRGAVLAATNGYGGIGDQIRAAVEEFQRALRAASDQFQEDVAACVAGLSNNSADLTANFRSSTNAAVSDFSAQTASPTTFSNPARFDSNLTAIATNLDRRLDSGGNQLTAAFDSRQASRDHRNAFRQCMKDARNDFRDAIADARRAFREALRGIFR